MADFQLVLELTTRIEDLERGMKDAQRAVADAAKQMESATKEASEKGMNPLLKSGLKLGAGLMVATGAINIAANAVKGFAGDSDAMAASISGIPLFGPLVNSIMNFGDALEYASDKAFGARAKIADLIITAKELDNTISIISKKIEATGRLERLKGTGELAIAENKYKAEVERLESIHTLQLKAIDEERMARHKVLEEQNLSDEEHQEQAKRIDEDRRRQIAAANEQLHIEKLILDLTLEKLRKAEEAEDAAKEAAILAERQAELDAEAAAHHELMLELGEEAKKKEEERLKMIEKQAKAQKEKAIEDQKALEKHLVFVKKVHDMKMDMAKVRAEAEMNVAQATSTFSTAGGSFTTGASAELIEAKLLTKISTASKELLAQIVANTAQAAGGFF